MVDFTSSLRLIKQEYRSNPESWGGELNAGVFDMVDEAFHPVVVPVAANVNLTVQNAVSDQSRRIHLTFTGAGGFTVTAPGVPKVYFVHNQCAADVQLAVDGGDSKPIRAGTGVWFWTDGATTNLYDPTLDKLQPAAADVSIGGQKITNLADGTADTDAANVGQVNAIVAQVQGDADAAAASAAAAAISEANAAASEAATQLLYDDFQKRYLGPKAVDPTVDNEGNPLTVGALYFNTTGNQMRVYTGSAWIIIELPPIATQPQAEAGVDNTTMMTPLRTKQAIDALAPVPAFENRLLHVRDEKPSGTSGGDAVVGWNSRVLNTVKTNQITGASLASNQISLPAGTYFIDAVSPVFGVGESVARLQNVSGPEILRGQNGYATGSSTTCYSRITGRFTLASTTNLRIQQYAAFSNFGGLGNAVSQGTEVYTSVMIWKVA